MDKATARTKWCPFARTGAYTDRGPMTAVSVGRDPRPEVSDSCLCIASDCMAWRESRKDSQTGGFCGLAGAP